MFGALIGAAGSLAGGLLQSRAAGKAADAQAASGRRGMEIAGGQLDRSRKDYNRHARPWQQAGRNAIGALSQAFGSGRGLDRFDWTNYQADPVAGLGRNVQRENKAYGLDFRFGDKQMAADPSSRLYKTAMREVGDGFNFEADPGYAWRREQGERALSNSAAARGNLLSGKSMLDAQRFGQGLASDEYGRAYGRYSDTRNFANSLIGGAYGRFMGSQGARLNQAVANDNRALRFGEFNRGLVSDAYGRHTGDKAMGVNALGSIASMGANMRPYDSTSAGLALGGFQTGIGNVQGAGIAAQGNALGQGISSGANSISDYMMLQKMLKR